MSNKDGGGEFIGAIIIFLIVAASVIVIVLASISIGAFYGGGKAAYNYALAFRNNVAPEQPLSPPN